MNMNQIFSAGDKITGFCNGYFGRDDYEDKRCVYVTTKFAVFQYDNGYATVLNLNEYLEEGGQKIVSEWRK